MNIRREVEFIDRMMSFLENRDKNKTMRESVIEYYMGLGEEAGITATQDVGVIVNGVEIGTVDCVIANPASVAIAYVEDKLGAMLGLWILAEFSPSVGVLAVSSGKRALVSDLSTIIRRSSLLRYSPVRFIVVDIEGGRKEVIQRRGGTGRRKIIKGKRPAYKKQD